MNKSKITKPLILGAVIVVSILIFTHYYIKNKIEVEIENAGFIFQEIDVNIILGDLDIINFCNNNHSDNSDSSSVLCQLANLEISGFSYWNLYARNNIE